MLNEEEINKIYLENQEQVEEKIQKEYHKRIKQIDDKNIQEKENIKLGIISELYYKQGFKDGIEFMKKNKKNR